MLRKSLSSLSTRFYAIVALAIATSAILATILLSLAIENAYEMRDLHLSDVTESAVSILEDLNTQVEEGKLTLEEAQAEGQRLLSAIRYGDSGYIFAYDGNHIARVYPIKPDWIGTDKSDLQDVNGVYLIQELVKIAKTQAAARLSITSPSPARIFRKQNSAMRSGSNPGNG